MPAFVPSAADLLEAAAADLERDVMPVLSGYAKYRARLAANAMALVVRELRQSAAADEAELARLRALLASDRSDLATLRAELATHIEAGDFALDDEHLVRHLRESLRASLAITHPGWT